MGDTSLLAAIVAKLDGDKRPAKARADCYGRAIKAVLDMVETFERDILDQPNAEGARCADAVRKMLAVSLGIPIVAHPLNERLAGGEG